MIAQVITFFPVAFITLDGVLSTISPTLEDAAFNLKASRWQVFTKVTLPLSVPGIASTMLVLFIESLADFGNPLILAGASFPVLSVQAYLEITGMFNLKKRCSISSMVACSFVNSVYSTKILGKQEKNTSLLLENQQPHK